MLTLVLKVLLKYALAAAGSVAIDKGICNSSEWITVAGVLTTCVSLLWHWIEAHQHAVAIGQVTGQAPQSGAGSQSNNQPGLPGLKNVLVLFLLLPAFLLAGGCAIPKDVAHVYHISGDGTSLGLTQNPTTQAYELGLKRVHTTLSIVPIVWQTNGTGNILAVVPDTVLSDEINGRSTIFGGAGGTITLAVGTNAVQTLLGGQHYPINQGSGTNIPK